MNNNTGGLRFNKPEWNFRYFLFLFIIIICISCENTLHIHAPGEATPIVYGLLSPDKPFQQVRIGRSYQSGRSQMNQQDLTDSTVWNLPIEVYMEEWTDGYPSKIIYFNPFTGVKKDTGFFPTENLRVYQANYQVKLETKYYLYVYFPDTERIASGWTIVPGRPDIEDPKEVPGRKMTILPDRSYTLRGKPAKNGNLYQGEFSVYIRQELQEGWTTQMIKVPTKLFIEMNPMNLVSNSLNGRRFYDSFIDQLETDPDVTRRIFSVDYRFYTGGTELAFYVMGQSGDSESFASIQEYSNINNGVGVFSSILIDVVPNLEFSNITLDTLAHHELTKHLGFVDHKGE